MIAVTSQGGRPSYFLKEFVVDTEDDLEFIQIKKVLMGSTAFVIDTKKVFMLNGEGIWKEV